MRENPHRFRILVLTDTMTAGGSGRFVALLLQHLDRERFEVELAKVFDTEPLYDIPDDVRVYSLVNEPPVQPSVDWGIPEDALDGMGEGVAWMQSVVDRIAHLVRRIRPDIVYCAPEWVSVVAAAASPRFPEPTQLVCRVGCPPSVAFPDAGRTRLHALLLRRYFGRAASVVAISDEIARELVADFGVDSGLITVFHNPIDVRGVQRLAAESVEELDLEDGVPSVAFVGRLERFKNLDGLLRAIASLNARRPVRCVLVGDGNQRGYLQALAKHLGISERVHFVGAQSNPFRFVSKASVFVLPSFHEGLGSVILEAMACGRPIVATDIAGGITRYLLDQGECGLLVPIGDVHALADALARLLEDDELASRRARSALQRVAMFDVGAAMREHEQLLAALGTKAVALRALSAAAPVPCVPEDEVSREGVPSEEAAPRSPQPAQRAPARLPVRGAEPRVPGKLRDRAATARMRRRLTAVVSKIRDVRHARSPQSAPPTPSPGRTKIMVLVPHLDDISTGSGVQALLRGLDRSRFEVALARIFGGQDSVDLPGDVVQYAVPIRRAIGDGASVAEPLRARFGEDAAWLSAVAAGVSHLVAQDGTDVIIAQGYVATCAATAARRSLPPTTGIVSAIHTHASQFAGADGPMGFYGELLRTQLRQADLVLVPSEEIRRSVVDACGVDPERVLLAPDPVGIDQAASGNWWPTGAGSAEPAPPWVFASIAEPGFTSGAEQLVEALSLIRQQEDARCLMIGEFEDASQVRDAVERLRQCDAVEFLAEGRAREQGLASARAYVCPASRRGEGLPSALVGALRRRLPVISTDSSVAVSELLGDGRYGLLVRRDDPQALAEAMLQLMWDTELRDKTVREAAEHISSLSVESHVRRYEQSVDACVRARSSAASTE